MDLDQRPLSSELQDALGLWADQLWDHLHHPSAAWQSRGEALYATLVHERGADYVVSLEDS